MARGIGNGRGKPVTTKTRLGRAITDRKVKVYVLCGATDITPRLMTEYIAGRKIPQPHHLEAICRVLDCEPEEILEPQLKSDLTDSTGTPIGKKYRSVKELDMSHLEPEPPRPDLNPAFRPAHKPIAPERIVRKVG